MGAQPVGRDLFSGSFISILAFAGALPLLPGSFFEKKLRKKLFR